MTPEQSRAALYLGRLAKPFTCKLCGKLENMHLGENTTRKLIKDRHCYNCYHALKIKDDESAIIVNGSIDKDGGWMDRSDPRFYSSFRGYGGREFYFRMNDGRVVRTNNLWHHGSVPDHLKADLPDNATCITREEYEAEL